MRLKYFVIRLKSKKIEDINWGQKCHVRAWLYGGCIVLRGYFYRVWKLKFSNAYITIHIKYEILYNVSFSFTFILLNTLHCISVIVSPKLCRELNGTLVYLRTPSSYFSTSINPFPKWSSFWFDVLICFTSPLTSPWNTSS